MAIDKNGNIIKLTRNQAIRACRRMWRELAVTGSGEKDSTKEIQKYIAVSNNCFLCDTSNQSCHYGFDNFEDTFKDNCIFKWGRFTNIHATPCHQNDSPYKKWVNAETNRIRMMYAKIISELPVRKY
jgi:hypothetical protein